jgi:hypothetical protein
MRTMVSDGELTAPLNDDMSQPLADPDEGLSLPSSAEVAGMAWAFTQYEPLSTSEFISQAQRRGLYLDTGRLRQLYRPVQPHATTHETRTGLHGPR